MLFSLVDFVVNGRENIFLFYCKQSVDFAAVVEVILRRWNVQGRRLMFVFKRS